MTKYKESLVTAVLTPTAVTLSIGIESHVCVDRSYQWFVRLTIVQLISIIHIVQVEVEITCYGYEQNVICLCYV